MRFSNAFHTAIFGMSGCGKSTLTSRIAEQHPRKIVFDYVEEWTGSHQVHNVEEFKAIWRTVFNRDRFTIVVRFQFGVSDDHIEETTAKISEIVYMTGRESDLPTALIFEEAQFYFPSNRLNPVMKSLFTTGRHAAISIIFNTQRPASIHKLAVSQASQVFIGRIYEMNDIKYLTDTVGEIAEQARSLKQLEFIYYDARNPENSSIVQL